MCQSRTNNRNINMLHEICFPFIYKENQLLFSELLEMDWSVSIHLGNIQSLAIEMFSVSRSLSPYIINEIFTQKDDSRYNIETNF